MAVEQIQIRNYKAFENISIKEKAKNTILIQNPIKSPRNRGKNPINIPLKWEKNIPLKWKKNKSVQLYCILWY